MKFTRLNKSNFQSGFTLIELLVVIIILGVLAGIAAPGWLGFLERQRLSSAQDKLFQAMQSAQNKAQQRSQSWQVSIREGTESLELSTHSAASVPSLWEPIGDSNTLIINPVSTVPSTAGTYSIEFDDKGNIVDGGVPLPIRITLSSESGGQTRRSVEIRTLIGGIRRTND